MWGGGRDSRSYFYWLLFHSRSLKGGGCDDPLHHQPSRRGLAFDWSVGQTMAYQRWLSCLVTHSACYLMDELRGVTNNWIFSWVARDAKALFAGFWNGFQLFVTWTIPILHFLLCWRLRGCHPVLGWLVMYKQSGLFFGPFFFGLYMYIPSLFLLYNCGTIHIKKMMLNT